MNNGKVVGGVILLAVAIWLFLTMSDATARYLGGAILGILGITLIATGMKSEE